MRIKRFFKYFGISIAILVGGFLVAGQIAYHSIADVDSPPGKMYSVNGGEIHMHCTGPENDEKPTIIIISGAGTPSFLYSYLQEKLSETVRTCSYDTAGIAWSKANDIPYTAKNMSSELHQLLKTAQIDGPIILAGHSMGGIVSLIYSAEYEEQVAGIVFIDSSHYNQVDYFGKEFRDTLEKQDEEELTSLWWMEFSSKLGITKMMNNFDTSMSEIEREEYKMMESFDKWNPPYSTMRSMISNFNLSFEQGKDVHYDRGNLPIIAISASGIVSDDHLSSEIGGVSEEELSKGFIELHKDLAELSTNGRHVIVEETDHFSMVFNDETAEHILSLIPLIEEK
ncbi:alpha/beta hydrolase [Nitrosopumilus sp.]|uniref:alpha/beta hydrolase n=1 Tax=Nitrosopumilus sp. TaxID=2024843 RepID=UPI00293082D1|nr:alpha/beta hydrolase [Nitrosopumilus sp.]